MARPPQIPGYQLLSRLGGGPTCRVYAARDLDTDDEVAVKYLRPQSASDPTAIKLLQREARAGLAVRHPHLVRVRHVHVTRPPYFLVMDLLPGESARDRLKREYELDLRTALWVARQTAEALAALHRAGFVHSDVKPENVRLIDGGDAVLIDLGFAHRPGENAQLFDDGFVLGTANYLAPELCVSGGESGPASDVFSLGVTLFELITGGLPYPADTLTQTLVRHRDDDPADLRERPGDWPEPLARLLERMMARKPNQRPHAAVVVRELVALEIAALGVRRAG